MIDLDSARNWFEVNITDQIIGIPLQYENVPDSTELKKAKKDKASWARLTILDGEAQGVSLGANILRRYTGLAMLSVFVTQGVGTKKVRDVATTISRYIVNQRVANMVLYTPSFNLVGNTEDWWQGNITMPFQINQLTN